MNKRDAIFSVKKETPEPFSFNKEVAEAFDDMAVRSIPGYRELQQVIARISIKYYREGTSIYDLGCSTGNTILEISRSINTIGNAPVPRIIALDKSEEMISIARAKCAGIDAEFVCRDIGNIDISHASVVIAAYVLQFMDPMVRKGIVDRIYLGLEKGGAFILAEKVESRDPDVQSLITGLYHDFKRKNGYSDLEISQKDEALKGVLVPFTIDDYMALIRSAGFRHAEILMKRLNFLCLLAVK